jgi:4-carboxymuconolactone decarboxylase
MAARCGLLPSDDPRWQGDLRHYRLPGGIPIPLFAAVASQPGVLAELRSETRNALTGTSPVRFREIVVLRICARAGCWPEWDVHVVLFAQAAGLNQADLLGIRTGQLMSHEHDGLAIRLADAAISNEMDDGLWEGLSTAGSPDQVIEWITLAGQYVKVCWMSIALAVPRPSIGSEGGPR